MEAVWVEAVGRGLGGGGRGSDLRPVVVEDAHQADRHGLVDTAAQGLPGEGEHEGHGPLPARLYDGVERLVQTTWTGRSQPLGEEEPRVRGGAKG